MIIVEMICLANSRKEGGRCIAGIRTDGKGWIRPVSPIIGGTLYGYHYSLQNGSEVQVLDLIEVPLIKPLSQPHQPENWLIETSVKWKLIQRPASKRSLEILDNYINTGPFLFGDDCDRIAASTYQYQKSPESLTLISPSDFKFEVKLNQYRGNLQKRLIFSLGGAEYNLVLTDPRFENFLEKQGLGVFTPIQLGFSSNQKVYLTISLGEQFRSYHYKLVASVIFLPLK